MRLDEDTKMRLEQGERIVEVLKQDRNSPVDVELQVVIIYAVINGFLKDIEVEDIKEYQNTLFDYVKNSYYKIIENISSTGDLSDETKKLIEDAISDSKKAFLAAK